MGVMIWQEMYGSGLKASILRMKKVLFCAAARGAAIVSGAGARIAATTDRVSGSAALVFVVPGLLHFRLLPFYSLFFIFFYFFLFLAVEHFCLNELRKRLFGEQLLRFFCFTAEGGRIQNLKNYGVR